MFEEPRAFYKGDNIKFTTSEGFTLLLDVVADGYTRTIGYQAQSYWLLKTGSMRLIFATSILIICLKMMMRELSLNNKKKKFANFFGSF